MINLNHIPDVQASEQEILKKNNEIFSMTYTIFKPEEIWSQSDDIYKAFLILFNLLNNFWN